MTVEDFDKEVTIYEIILKRRDDFSLNIQLYLSIDRSMRISLFFRGRILDQLYHVNRIFFFFPEFIIF